MGFMVALFYCFLNTEVQNTLKHHFENWKTKKSLGPSRLRSSSRSKDWSLRSRTESLRNTEWTLVGADDLEDYVPATKEALLINQRKESAGQLHHQLPRKFSNELGIGASGVANPRKESLVHQPLLEMSEESSPTVEEPPPKRVTEVIFNQKGEAVVIVPSSRNVTLMA